MEEERMNRTRSLLESINHAAASAVLPDKQVSDRERAAITCQKYARAKLARKEFAARLYVRFMEEEKEREEKQRRQVEEGEVLLTLRRMETEVGDAKTVNANTQRRRNDAATRIQRWWRRQHSYDYMDDYSDLEGIRLNPFTSIIPVTTVSAFSSTAQHAHADEPPAPGSAAATVARIHEEYAQDDWDLTPVRDVDSLAIAQLEAQLQAMTEMEEKITARIPEISDDEASSDEYDDDCHDDDEEGDTENTPNDYNDDDDQNDEASDDEDIEDDERGTLASAAKQTEGRQHSALHYHPRSFSQKSMSIGDIHNASFRSMAHTATAAIASPADANLDSSQAHWQSAGNLYHICYDSGELRHHHNPDEYGRSGSTESAGSLSSRKSPDGCSSGQPTPVHETSAPARSVDDACESKATGSTAMQPPGGESEVRGEAAGVRSISSTGSLPLERQYESVVLSSKWAQRRLTQANLEKLSDIQLRCILNEFKLLVTISSDELVRQLELRDDSVLRREKLQEEAGNLTQQQKKRTDEERRELLAFGAEVNRKLKDKDRKRFRLFSRKST
eukprot:scpid48280/ scgid12637/ 